MFWFQFFLSMSLSLLVSVHLFVCLVDWNLHSIRSPLLGTPDSASNPSLSLGKNTNTRFSKQLSEIDTHTITIQVAAASHQRTLYTVHQQQRHWSMQTEIIATFTFQQNDNLDIALYMRVVATSLFSISLLLIVVAWFYLFVQGISSKYMVVAVHHFHVIMCVNTATARW